VLLPSAVRVSWNGVSPSRASQISVSYRLSSQSVEETVYAIIEPSGAMDGPPTLFRLSTSRNEGPSGRSCATASWAPMASAPAMAMLNTSARERSFGRLIRQVSPCESS
jgi:hypothetical protein